MSLSTQITKPLATLHNCTVVNVHDGDSVLLSCPGLVGLLGFHASSPGPQLYVRIAGVNAAELATRKGKSIRLSVVAWLSATPFYDVPVFGREKYGRVLADVVRPGGELSLSSFLLTQGAPAMAIKEQLHEL